MTAIVLDYSFARPKPAEVKAHAFGVMRYLGKDLSKILSRTEAAALLKAGLRIGLVWETTANRATAGQAAGKQDALDAAAQAKALGYPAWAPIFFAVDVDVDPKSVTPYFQGIAAAKIPNPVGVYGSARVVVAIRGAKLAAYQWQTVAWSGRVVVKTAHLLQTTDKPPLPQTDVNRVQVRFPMWGDTPPAPPKAAAKAPAKAAPAPAKAPAKAAPAKAAPAKAANIGHVMTPAQIRAKEAASRASLLHRLHVAHLHVLHMLHLRRRR